MCMHIDQEQAMQCRNGAADEEDPGLRPAACKVADMDAVVDAILYRQFQFVQPSPVKFFLHMCKCS
ncbi:hypothetical protein PAHAL_5G469700 [Panicum hallii]|jgi:hypothetical protein|uniref:Uncharacterized protein n=1 Tax=Panicum hallii TaxID=206008 RepID=A0A2S3HXQ4_9POAL|nr:hypothetical protein PAHAL_5G469700 [Panicum hallii]